jgi:murein DD-endopeptidase MepM/ murein hydrolase activator NlpD
LRPPENSATGWPAWYGSYVVQIWHGQGRYTQYAHVDWVRPDIPYFPPATDEHGNLMHNAVLRAPVKQLMAQGKRVRRGELLALSGMTGCGWGFRCYDTAALTIDSRPDFRNSDYTYWDQPHLHFMVFSARAGKARRPRQLWDPFGLYGDVSAGYSEIPTDWSLTPHSLWL